MRRRVRPESEAARVAVRMRARKIVAIIALTLIKPTALLAHAATTPSPSPPYHAHSLLSPLSDPWALVLLGPTPPWPRVPCEEGPIAPPRRRCSV